MTLSLGLKNGVMVVPWVDAMVLSSLLLKAAGSLISIPSAFEPFQLSHPCNFSTQLLHPVASPPLQLLHSSGFSISATSPPHQLLQWILHLCSFSTPPASPPLQFPHPTSPSLQCLPPSQHPLQLLFHPSLLWAFILCCLCTQIRSLQVILSHPLSKLCLWVQRKNKPISVKRLTVCPSQTPTLCSRNEAFQEDCVLENRPQGSVLGILLFTWALFSLPSPIYPLVGGATGWRKGSGLKEMPNRE